MSLTIEEEAGFYTRIPTHNGYYAADFCDVPEATPRQLSALTRLRQPATRDWADSYLAAFAAASQLILVTFDRGLRRRAKSAILLAE